MSAAFKSPINAARGFIGRRGAGEGAAAIDGVGFGADAIDAAGDGAPTEAPPEGAEAATGREASSDTFLFRSEILDSKSATVSSSLTI